MKLVAAFLVRIGKWSMPKILAMSLFVFSTAGAFKASAQTGFVDYSEPKVLIGDIFAPGAEPHKLLFKSERRSTRNKNTVQVTCDYTYPDGSLAARDRIIYEGGQLALYEEEELQIGEKGTAIIRADPKHPGRRKIYFEYTVGRDEAQRKTSGSEELENDTLIDDMIPGFIASRWTALENGSPERFRYIVLSRKETVGFKLVKEADLTWRGKPAVRIRMEPTSFIISKLVDPLFFVVEKSAPNRILEYTGRTTPLIKAGNKWKELDAVSVFEWP